MKLLSSLLSCALAFILMGGASLSGSQDSPSTNPLESFQNFTETRALMRQAEECQDRGDYKKAAKFYRKAAALQTEESKKAEFLYLRAQSLLQAHRVHDALEAYTDLLENHLYQIPLENALEQLRQLADDFQQGRGTFLGLKDQQAAIHVYKVIVQYQPDVRRSLDDRMVLAAKQEQDSDVEGAVATYQEILKALPSDADARFRLAALLDKTASKRDGDGELSRAAIREAKRFLQDAGEGDPRRSEAEGFLSQAQEREAARLWERATFYLGKYHSKPQIARRYLLDLRRDYPDTEAGRKARLLLSEKFPDDLQ